MSWTPAQLNDVGDLLDVGIFIVDAELVIRGWNEPLERMSGTSREEMVGRALLDAFPDLRETQGEAAIRRALAGGTEVLSHRLHRYLLPLPPPAGFETFDRMQQSARVVPLVSEEDEASGALVMIQDVTERVAREEALREAIQRAEAASAAKSDFLAAMSHELRTPLVAVVGYSDLMVGGMIGPITPVQRDRLERIKASAMHLLSIVEEILTFSRVEAGRESLHVAEFDACELAREAAMLIEPQALLKNLTLRVNVPADRLVTATDKTKLRQILVNLLGNAVKFTDEGSVALEVACDADRLVVRVTDTGNGIAPQNLEQIFEPFTQVDQSRTRRQSGTGLGLAVSRKLAQLLGGDLVARSEVGKGSTFTLTCPLRADAAAHPAPRERAAATNA